MCQSGHELEQKIKTAALVVAVLLFAFDCFSVSSIMIMTMLTAWEVHNQLVDDFHVA